MIVQNRCSLSRRNLERATGKGSKLIHALHLVGGKSIDIEDRVPLLAKSLAVKWSAVQAMVVGVCEAQNGL